MCLSRLAQLILDHSTKTKTIFSIYLLYLFKTNVFDRREARVAERNNFNIYCLARELFWPLQFRFIFSFNEDDLCHSVRMTFPGNIKGCVNALSLSSSLILAAEQTNINMRRAHPIFGPLFSLEDHSFIIYSFLLDQVDIEASSWMLSSLYTTHSTGLSLKLRLKF